MIDMRMYKYPDYRCLKPKPGLPSSQWPHYDMEQHRAAKSLEELDKVEEIPFDKESSESSDMIIKKRLLILILSSNDNYWI